MMPSPRKQPLSRAAEVHPLLRSKMRFYRTHCAYADFHAAAQQGARSYRLGALHREKIHPSLHSPLVVANRLDPLSYVSYDTALKWHGIIPESTSRVIRSACSTGRSHTEVFGTEIYAYTRQEAKYYAVGQLALPRREPLYNIATPAKALCDLILSTPNVFLPTRAAVYFYLLDTLHADKKQLYRISPEIVHRCAMATKKKHRDLLTLESALREILTNNDFLQG